MISYERMAGHGAARLLLSAVLPGLSLWAKLLWFPFIPLSVLFRKARLAWCALAGGRVRWGAGGRALTPASPCRTLGHHEAPCCSRFVFCLRAWSFSKEELRSPGMRGKLVTVTNGATGESHPENREGLLVRSKGMERLSQDGVDPVGH